MKPVTAIALLLAVTPTPGAGEDTAPPAESPAVGPALSSEAAFQEARRLLLGEGAARDPERAYELMKQAADAGHPDAAGGLGNFHREGVVVPQNDAEAAAWYRKGAEKGGVRSQFNFGQVLLNGLGVERNVEEGLRWIREAASQGLPQAVFVLGQVHYFGQHGQAVNYDEAFAYFRTEAERGHPDAQNMLGVMYENAQGQPRDEARAIAWYRKAAEQNLAKAQSNLGRMLGPNSASKDTRVEALMWLFLADAQGEITAARALKEVRPGIDSQEEIDARRRAAAFQGKQALWGK